MKAKVKYLSDRLAFALLQNNLQSHLAKGYKMTIGFCSKKIDVDAEGFAKTLYCKQRWCATCGRINTAKMINGYQSQLSDFSEPYFLTLTLETVSGENLKNRIQTMEKEWGKILVNNRNNKFFDTMNGIRKMECTLRPGGMYHYHFHILIDGKAQAEWILEQWFKRFPLIKKSKSAQDLRPADERSYKEIFKYFTKPLAQDSGLFTEERGVTQFKRLDFLYRVLYGKRIFQPFGKVKREKEYEWDTEKAIQIPKGKEGLVWSWIKNDWWSEWGEALADFTPDESLEKLLRHTPKDVID